MWERLFKFALGRMIRKGSLHIHTSDGRKMAFGDGTGAEVNLHVENPAFFRHFILNPELALGEGYSRGDLRIEGGDLSRLLSLGMDNRDPTRDMSIERIYGPVLTRLRQFNPRAKSRQNVAHHYDLSGELYELFLDADRQYSCAYFRDPGDTLEAAQIHKKAHIASKLLLEPGMRVLDIGCGWGGMAETLARDYGVEVIGVTLSEEQLTYARARVEKAGLQDRIEFRMQDYRDVPETFDRIVSVGMFEHVGKPHFPEFFGTVRDRLTDNGIALIHTIARSAPPVRSSPWITKYIFPGGYIPSLSDLSGVIERSGLILTDLEVLRLHYAETLKHWHERFMANHDKAVALYDEEFCRMWEFYLKASEMAFRVGTQVIFQMQFAKNRHALPLTRDYMYRN